MTIWTPHSVCELTTAACRYPLRYVSHPALQWSKFDYQSVESLVLLRKLCFEFVDALGQQPISLYQVIFSACS